MDNQPVKPSSVSTAEIENFLIRRLGEPEAREIIQYIHTEIEKKVDERVGAVHTEIAAWRSAMKDEFLSKDDAEDLKQRLVRRVSKVEGTIILWGFVFWITTILAIYIIYKFVI